MKDSIRTWLTEQFGPDPDLHNELYDQYAADMKSAFQEVEDLFVSGCASALGEKGHAMKGMALQMGDEELSTPCKALQDAGRAGDISTCASLLPEIKRAVAAL